MKAKTDRFLFIINIFSNNDESLNIVSALHEFSAFYSSSQVKFIYRLRAANETHNMIIMRIITRKFILHKIATKIENLN